MRTTIKAVSVIIGTIIGAGFASGKEIYIFFNVYGVKGLLGITISTILTGIIIYKVLISARDKRIKNYNTYLERLGLNKKVKQILNIIVNIFLLITFYIMIAGFTAYFKQEFNIMPLFISIIVSFLCYITLINNIEGITKVNMFLCPILILIIVFIGIKIGDYSYYSITDKAREISSNIKTTSNWLIASLEYASYNNIMLIPMLITLKKYTYKKEKKIAILSSVIFLMLAIILYVILLNGGASLNNVELPSVWIMGKTGTIFKYICGLVVVLAIYTSAIAAGHSFIENQKDAKRLLTIILCISAIFVYKIGFSNLVKVLYPVFGLIGLVQLVAILIKK